MQGDTLISSSSGMQERWVEGDGGLGDLEGVPPVPPPRMFGRSSMMRDFGLEGSGDIKL